MRSFRMVKILMGSNELDVNAVDNYKNTALHIACEEGNPEVVKMLLNAGANMSMQNKDEKTPVMFLHKNLFISDKSFLFILGYWKVTRT